MDPKPLMPRLLAFRPFAERLGVDPDVLRQDDECPPVVSIGGIEHVDLAALAKFEVDLLIRAWGEECEANRAKAARHRAARAVAGEAATSAPAPA